MPELQTRNGYFLVLAIMIILGVGMTLYFRHRGWVGTPPPPNFDSKQKE